MAIRIPCSLWFPLPSWSLHSPDYGGSHDNPQSIFYGQCMLREAKITKAITELYQGSPFGPHFHQLIKGTAWTHMLSPAKAAPGCSSSFAKEMTHSFLPDLCKHFRLLPPPLLKQVLRDSNLGLPRQADLMQLQEYGGSRGVVHRLGSFTPLKAFISHPENQRPYEKKIQMTRCNLNWS